MGLMILASLPMQYQGFLAFWRNPARDVKLTPFSRAHESSGGPAKPANKQDTDTNTKSRETAVHGARRFIASLVCAAECPLRSELLALDIVYRCALSVGQWRHMCCASFWRFERRLMTWKRNLIIILLINLFAPWTPRSGSCVGDHKSHVCCSFKLNLCKKHALLSRRPF